jgi:hypothetical protein
MWRYKGPSSLVSPTFESPGVNQLSPFYSSYRLPSRKKFSLLALSPSLDVTIKVQLYQYLDLRILYHQSAPYAQDASLKQ